MKKEEENRIEDFFSFEAIGKALGFQPLEDKEKCDEV